MLKLAVNMPGFRVLLSDAMANMCQILIFGLWNSLLILFQTDIFPVESRLVISFLNDWIWFSMSTHYSLVAFSRFAAICWPFWFLTKFKNYAYSLCAAVWIGAAIQTAYLHSQDWWFTFCYDPRQYGMVMEDFNNFFKGQSTFWRIYNMIVVITPLLFYTPAIICAMKNRKTVSSGASQDQQRHMSIEKRIVVPCIINQGIYTIEAYMFIPFYERKIGLFKEGKWALFILCLIFVTNSLVNPILLFSLSSEVRKGVIGYRDTNRRRSQRRNRSRLRTN